MKFKIQESDQLTSKLNEQQLGLRQILPKAFRFFRNITPKDQGNARRNTYIQGNEIKANYPYAEPLDKGHSKQAPKGMTQPTIEYIKRLVNELKRK